MTALVCAWVCGCEQSMVKSAISTEVVAALLDGNVDGNVDVFKQAVKQKLVAEVLPIDWSVSDVALTGTIPLCRICLTVSTETAHHWPTIRLY
jgi:hypothetical protein